ncbi:ribosome assembly factor SBDS [Candidatus Micrarchaeota archaeon]|nr:ribosome assembly factor SBDS [Candidatus Micrarchaeota archaeon]
MASLDTAIIAHLETHGERFELLVDSQLAYQYKIGKKTDLNNVLVVEEVFKDAKKGERHKAEVIKKVFGTNDLREITDKILKKGEIQLTTEQKRQMLQEKTKKIVAILARECIDPRTDAPHPAVRIEKALEEAKVHIDAFKDAGAQIDDVVKALRLVLPLKFEKIKIAIRVPPEHAPRSYGTIKEFGIQKEEWQKDGSLIVVIEIPAGMQSEFYDKINKLTNGNVETKVIK